MLYRCANDFYQFSLSFSFYRKDIKEQLEGTSRVRGVDLRFVKTHCRETRRISRLNPIRLSSERREATPKRVAGHEIHPLRFTTKASENLKELGRASGSCRANQSKHD